MRILEIDTKIYPSKYIFNNDFPNSTLQLLKVVRAWMQLSIFFRQLYFNRNFLQRNILPPKKRTTANTES